jgi:hypothetical protein
LPLKKWIFKNFIIRKEDKNMKKNLIAISIVAAMAASMGTAALASDDVTVVVNGETIDFTGDQAPVIVDERTLVPFRAVFEKLGAKVEWFDDIQTCEATFGSITVSLAIGSNTMYVGDGTTVEVDVPAQIMNERTMVPIRVISEGIGATVGWDDATRTVTVDAPEPSSEFPAEITNTTASSSVTNEEKGITVKFDYPVVSDEYTAADKLNKTILEDITSIAQQTADEYAGDLKELNITYTLNSNEGGVFEVLYIINDDEMIFKPSYSTATGAALDEDYLEKTYDIGSAEEKGYEMLTYTAEATDENGNAYINASVAYPQFISDESIIASLNTQLENSAKKAADSFVASYADEAKLLEDAEYSFTATCNVTIDENNTAVITTEYSEITNVNKSEYSDVITVNLTTGEVADETAEVK